MCSWHLAAPQSCSQPSSSPSWQTHPALHSKTLGKPLGFPWEETPSGGKMLPKALQGAGRQVRGTRSLLPSARIPPVAEAGVETPGRAWPKAIPCRMHMEMGPGWERGSRGGWGCRRCQLCLKVAAAGTQGHLALLLPAVSLLNHPSWHRGGLSLPQDSFCSASSPLQEHSAAVRL